MDDLTKVTIPNSGKSTRTHINVTVLLLVLATCACVVCQVTKLWAASPAPDSSQNTTKSPSGNSESAAPNNVATSLLGLANSLNLIAFPATLDFGKQVTGTTSGVQTVTLTAKPDASVHITVTSPTDGNFAVLPATCDLEPSASCALTVTFAPKHIQTISSSLTITAVATPVPPTSNNAASAATPKNVTTSGVILLTGEGTGSCPTTGPIFPQKGWFTSRIPWLMVVLGFILVLMLVRWHMVAVPTRRLAESAIVFVQSRVDGLKAATTRPPPGLDNITKLLTQASTELTNETRLQRSANCLFWTRGLEMRAWGYVHEAEEQLVPFLPADSVRAALERAESDLRQAGTPPAVALADSIHEALVATPGAPGDKCRPLLAQVLAYLSRLDADLSDRVCRALDPKSSATAADCQTILQDAATALEPTAATKLADQIDEALTTAQPAVGTLIPLLQQASKLLDPRAAAALAAKIRATLANPPATIDLWKPNLGEICAYFKPPAAALADSIR